MNQILKSFRLRALLFLTARVKIQFLKLCYPVLQYYPLMLLSHDHDILLH